MTALQFACDELRVISICRVPLPTCTLAALVADTGETPRALNHWTDIGILRAERTSDRKGRGNRRVYPDCERKYALVASAINRLRLPLADVKVMIDQLRDASAPMSGLGVYAMFDGRSVSVLNEADLFKATLSASPAVILINISKIVGT